MIPEVGWCIITATNALAFLLRRVFVRQWARACIRMCKLVSHLYMIMSVSVGHLVSNWHCSLKVAIVKHLGLNLRQDAS